MFYQHSDGLRFFTFDNLSGAGIPHGIFTRRGGQSLDPWASLNLGGTVGDDPQAVRENRRRAFNALGRSFESAFDVWQVHSTIVVCADFSRPPKQPHIQADAILTDNPNVTLFMRFADCVPIVLYDPKRKVVGLVHAGWQGTVEKIVHSAVQTMESRYHSKPEDILAGIGPSIGSHHYPVGEDVVSRVRAAFGSDADQVLDQDEVVGSEFKGKFDLWKANQLLLENCGVKNIEVAGICTACHLDDWYSHRAENGKTGRFGALIGL